MKKNHRIEKIPSDFIHFKPSGVMVLLDSRGRIILTRRALHLRTHRGQFSFPGGKQDPEDQSLKDTALRETLEEMGIKPEWIDAIKPLPPVFSPRGYLLFSFLGHLKPGHPPFQVNADEVGRVVKVPLRFFKQQKPLIWHYHIKGIRVRADFYRFGPHLIWGATARIITGLKTAGPR